MSALGRTPPASQQTRDLLPPGNRIHRNLVVLATVVSGLFLVALVFISLVSGEAVTPARVFAPGAVCMAGLVMLIIGRPHAGVHLAVGMTGLIVIVSVDGSSVPGDPLLGLMSMGLAGTVLVRNHAWWYIVGCSVMIGVAGAAWHPAGDTVPHLVADGFSASATFLITAMLLHWLRRQSTLHRTQLERLVTAKDGFVAAISHELRTPLTTIVGLSAELSDRLDQFSAEELRELLTLMRHESEDVAHIVEDLLVVGQDGVGELQLDRRRFRIAEELRGALASVPEVWADVEPHDGLEVYADPGRTRQILRNLVTNARRYGGPQARLVLRKTIDRAVIEVRDTGDPIPLRDRELMFLPYHRAPAENGIPGSVGLGLTVSRRLARLMEGDIDYHHDGVESVFTFSLPLLEDESQPGLTAVA